MTPRLTIVGAGPGDADLITLKAIKAIKSANVILYDALVNVELLKYASPKTEFIFVGKRKGCYAYQQEQINELVVQRALRFGHVVRLKGGDPFIFGRGAEELDYAKEYAIEVAVVPGISSSAAVPAYQGIPLTKRNASESFWVITGTTKSHKISGDIALAAKSTATVVILMGMSKLSEIVQIFSNEGRSDTAIAIIQNGTRPNENVGIGKISNIESIVEEKQLANPAIIIIGEVVNQRVDLSNIYSQADLALASSKKQVA
ncbi:uroporphyrinogen-III C-methyltransferase [Winogradskyella sp. SM1960]|uniref:uroporphyrinogen-III C-methyltransferase n=1 Tax=Winogradskyella sp. SM1960 TaxID=2865955 RepID=UPI001CD39BDC|nr:uroporphyrinogen-III C-methyltransferase [Winogradskyella sp. SM1960]